MTRSRSPLPARSSGLFFLVLLLLAGWFFDPNRFSTDLLSVFPKNSQLETLEDAGRFRVLNRLMIVSEGFDARSRERIEAIAAALGELKEVSRVDLQVSHSDGSVGAFLQGHYYERARFDTTEIDDAFILSKLRQAYARMREAFIFVPLNSADPLGLFSDRLHAPQVSEHDGLLAFEQRGYMLSATLSIAVSDVAASQALHAHVTELLRPYAKVSAFAPHFFSAENSQKIKGEVNFIIALTTLLLFLFYAVALRDFKMLLLASAALGASFFIGIAAVTACFEEVSLFTLAFGAGISTMAVDYFFHLYFHGFYQWKNRNRANVTLAYATTAMGFGILLFADFPLVAQLSLFGIAALGSAWFIFAYLYANIPLAPHANRLRFQGARHGVLPPWAVAALSVVLLIVGATQLQLDTNLQNLDYRNTELLALKAQMQRGLDAPKPLIVYGGSLNELLEQCETLKAEYPALRSIADLFRSEGAFEAYRAALEKVKIAQLGERVEALARQSGFRPGTFASAYAFDLPEKAHIDLNIATALGFETVKLDHGGYATLAYLPGETRFEARPFAVTLDSGALLREGVGGVLDRLLISAALTLAAITAVLMLFYRGRFLRSLNYVLFPMGVIFCLIAFTTQLSIMHLFALIIVMVAGIDYGIYMNRPKAQTHEAIIYAMLTTFAGFGIFIFSNIGALYHIGTVITAGIVALFALGFLQKQERG